MKNHPMRALFAILLAFSLLLASLPGLAETALDETQKNSIAMLNYLAMLTQEINASKNSRLYLEQAYSSLINNIYPNAIDDRTLAYLSGILDTLESYRMTTVKRERLEFVFEQNKAQALRSIVPNPVSILNIVQSKNKAMIAISIASLALDSLTSYMSQASSLNLQHLREGWDLDDEEAATLHNSRKDAFSYMIRIVGEYNLPGDLALNENSVAEFVAAKNNSNLVQRIHFLESNVKTYQSMGEYWLLLIESYYRQGEFAKCLEALNSYEAISARIFRKDYGLAKVLPLAISAAENIKPSDEYIEFASEYSTKILDNIDNDEWALRYFVAQTFIELFPLTNDKQYLTRAYDLVLDNVNNLVNYQKDLNAAYLADVKTADVPKDAPKNVKTQIENYNKQLKEERKTALAPIYEPLLLNAELLYMLANELQIPEADKAKIDVILHQSNDNIFLVPEIDEVFRFTENTGYTPDSEIELWFNGKEINIPARYVSDNYKVKVTVIEEGVDEKAVFEDWVISRVDRKSKAGFDTFITVMKSDTANKYKYSANANVVIEVLSIDGLSLPVRTFRYTTQNAKEAWWEVVKLWEDNISFERNQE